MQASANPPAIHLALNDFKNIYQLIAENPASLGLKKYLRQHFMHLLQPEAYAELTAIEKRVLLVGVEVLARKSSLDEEVKKNIKAIKQDIENDGVLFLELIKYEKQPFIDFINFCDAQAEPEQKPTAIAPTIMRAGHAVDEENGAVRRKDDRLSYLVNALHRQGINALRNRNIQNALQLFQSAYNEAQNISDVNETMRNAYFTEIKASVINALKGQIELLVNQGERHSNEGRFASAIVAHSQAVEIAKTIYDETNNAELLVENQLMLVDAYTMRGIYCEITLKNYDDAILYYRAALAVHRQILPEFQDTFSINFPVLTIYYNFVNCYLAKVNLANNDADKIKFLKAAMDACHFAFEANDNMPEGFQEDAENRDRFALLQKNYADTLFHLGTLLYNEAVDELDAQNYEKAKTLFDEAIILLGAIPPALKNSSVDFLLAESYSNVMQIQRSMGVHFYNCEMYQNALEYFEDALKYAEHIPAEHLNDERISEIRECRQDHADCYQKLGTNHLAEKHYREALIYLILEYYYRSTPAEELNADAERQNQLKTCAVNLSESWNSLFHPKNDAKHDDKAAANPTVLRQPRK